MSVFLNLTALGPLSLSRGYESQLNSHGKNLCPAFPLQSCVFHVPYCGNSLCAGLFAGPCAGTTWERTRPCGPGGVLAMKRTAVDRASVLALFGPQLKRSTKILRSPRVSSIEDNAEAERGLRTEDVILALMCAARYSSEAT